MLLSTNAIPSRTRSCSTPERAGLLAAIASIGLLFLPAFAPAAVEYDFTLIEAFEVDYNLREVILRDIDETGTVIGTATHNGSYSGFVWTEETEKEVIPLLWPMGMNNLNDVVFSGQIYDFETGTTTNVLPAGGYPLPRLQHLNNHGVAVGYSECSCSNSDRLIQTALLWDAALEAGRSPFPPRGNCSASTTRIFAVGNIRLGAGSSEGFVYDIDAESHVNLSDLLPPSPYGAAYSELIDLSETNVATGRGYDGADVRGITWSQAEGFTFLDAIPGGLVDRVYPRGINSQGIVVGFADLTPYSPRAFVWDEQHGTRNLNDLVEAPANFILDWALKVNDQGTIVGIGHYGPAWGTSRGYVLIPRSASTSVVASVGSGPAAMRLAPNPVTDRLTVEFELASEGDARVTVFDVTGRERARLLDHRVPAGRQVVSWSPDATQAAGVYFVRVESGGKVESKQFILVR